MRVLLYGSHRYPAQRDEGVGLGPTDAPSGAPGRVLDLLARGLGEEGHEVLYLPLAGLDAPLPEGVHAVDVNEAADVEADVFHNVEVGGRPWVVTVQGHRPPFRYHAQVSDGRLVMPVGDEEPPYPLLENAVFVSRTLAERFGGSRYVHNGLDPADFVYSETKDDYLLFMAGMQGPKFPDMYLQKGLDLALGLAGEMGFDLAVAGTARERETLDRIAEMCGAAGARYLGDVGGAAKAELLAGARALIFPTRLHEGCPLVVLEALHSGTPVIASDLGSCPELVTPEVGFVCSNREAYRRAVEDVGRIDPAACRARAQREFHYRRMAREYVAEYERELAR